MNIQTDKVSKVINKEESVNMKITHNDGNFYMIYNLLFILCIMLDQNILVSYDVYSIYKLPLYTSLYLLQHKVLYVSYDLN